MSEYLPFQPPENLTEKPVTTLSQDQEEKRLKILKRFEDESYRLPSFDKGELMEEEKFWLVRRYIITGIEIFGANINLNRWKTNDCILRFLRASKWVLPTAIERLEATLKWRREFEVYTLITAEHVEPEVRAFTYGASTSC